MQIEEETLLFQKKVKVISLNFLGLMYPYEAHFTPCVKTLKWGY